MSFPTVLSSRWISRPALSQTSRGFSVLRCSAKRRTQACTELCRGVHFQGFTKMSSGLLADELVDLVNAIFTSLDKAADLIGQIWKVETMGDCYQVIIGGPKQCEDHAERGVELSLAILKLLSAISQRLDLPVRGRCGVHTGRVTAAVVGTLLPRYLVYGPDVNIVRAMEVSARHSFALTPLPPGRQLLRAPDPSHASCGRGSTVKCGVWSGTPHRGHARAARPRLAPPRTRGSCIKT
jgi:hypothetical protein